MMRHIKATPNANSVLVGSLSYKFCAPVVVDSVSSDNSSESTVPNIVMQTPPCKKLLMLPEMSEINENMTNLTMTPLHEHKTFGSKAEIIRQVKDYVTFEALKEFEEYWDECV